ncbi:hypothetical protein [Actinomadura sp. 3N407]|uniref:hypothetical protein n=1 Tax=Actinomadura sp. 3N407 TaxID=3457423 RepID=UPI003FCE3BF5
MVLEPALTSSAAPARGRARRIFVNWGLGADSTAWLLHTLDLLEEYRAGRLSAAHTLERAALPGDCDLGRLVVVVAMTGTEWPETKQLCEKHVLPRLAAASVRVVQVARAGPLQGHGITWLSDSNAPGCDPLVLHTGGDYRLIDEMLENGTIPTTGLDRRCSIHAKGWAADPAIAAIARGPDGRPEPYVQVMGFEDSRKERARAGRDAHHDTQLRTGVYPLVEMGWDRDRCLTELAARTGVAEWPKSACPMCLARETEVVTRGGVRTIAELSGGEHELLVPQVGTLGDLSHRGTFQRAAVRPFGVQRLYKVELRRSRSRKVVFATAEHRWFLAPGEGMHQVGVSTLERTTLDLNPGDALKPVQAVTLGREKLAPLAVAQGFVFGDGSRKKGRNSPATLTIFENGRDEALLPFFALCNPSKEQQGWQVHGMPCTWNDHPMLGESRTFLLSWLAGYFAAAGTVSSSGCAALCSAVLGNIEFVRDVAAICGVGYTPIRDSTQGTGIESKPLHQINLHVRDLPDWFFIIAEHRRRVEALRTRTPGPCRTAWKVVSVEPTDRVEEVYCAVVPQAGAFGLAEDLMTGNCPFGLATAAGRQRVLAGYARHPDEAVEVLLMEHGALAANERMGLIGGDRLFDLVAATPGLEHVVQAFEARMDEVEWSLYEVRRALKGRTVRDRSGKATEEMDPAVRGFTARRTVRLDTGTRAQMLAALAARGAHRGLRVDHSDPRHPRVWVRARGPVFPTVEQFYVIAPAVLRAKESRGFAGAWVACETYTPRRPQPEQIRLPEAG